MDYLYICKKGTTMWNEMSNPAVLMRIGQRIKETRIRQHITQEELATASGVSPLTVANIEKGKSVSLLLFISVLRSLGLLENLEQLVPEIRVSPIELKKLQGKMIKECRKSLKVNQLELLRTGGRGHQYAGGHRAWRRQS